MNDWYAEESDPENVMERLTMMRLWRFVLQWRIVIWLELVLVRFAQDYGGYIMARSQPRSDLISALGNGTPLLCENSWIEDVG
jgi:hypothetical protein